MSQDSWVWQQAQALAERTQDKEVVVFACGFGPSGLPHIGTFSEVVRTTMVRNVFGGLTGKSTRLIVFSDDMDALRKVPDNVPNRDMLEQHIGKRLSSVPNPFDTEYDSFSAHNNAQLCAFLDAHGFDYEFMSATECYKNGTFNDTLTLIAEHATEIKDIVTKDYGINGGNRKDTYCPFLPIVDDFVVQDLYDWRVCYAPHHTSPWMLHFYVEEASDDRCSVMNSFYNGDCKLQWKVDWPMRWMALGVDYEMHGKDLNGSAQVGHRICKLLNILSPMTYEYELFLDESGKKISKSIGNGLELSDWARYSDPVIISYYMFQNPRKARKLHFGVIPQMTDDYLKMLDKYHSEPTMDNPVWHAHGGAVPVSGSPVAFSMLLNLVSITATTDASLLWKFVQNYVPDATPELYPILGTLINYAIVYYEDKVLPFKTYRLPTDDEKIVLAALYSAIENVDLTSDEFEAELTSVIYEVGKSNYSPESLRDFFQMIYEVIMGQTSGPRLPIFVMLVGIDKFLSILKDAIE